MKRRFRIGAAVTLAALALSLVAGCGKKAEEQQPADAKPWTGTITVWDGPRWAQADDTTQNKFFYVEKKIKDFEASHPGVKVELVQVPWAEMSTKLTTAIAGQAWPDIAPVDISGGGVSTAQVEQGILVDMGKYLTKEQIDAYYPAAVDAYSLKGKLYGLPTSMTVHTLLLNLDLFKQANVEPPKDGKWTWDEFQTKMKALTTKLGDKQVYGFSTYLLKGYYEFWPFLLMDGGNVVTADGKFTMDSPEIVGALQKMQDLKLVDKVTSPEYGIANTGDVFKAFALPEKRYVAVEPWATWAIASLRDNAKYKMDQFMVAEYPVGKSGKPVTISGVGGIVVFKQKEAGKEAVVAELAKALADDQVQFDYAKFYGTLPASKTTAAKNPYEGNEHMQRALQMLEHAVTLPTKVDGWSEVEPMIQAQLQLVIAGEKSAKDGIAQAKADSEPLLIKK